MNIHNILLYSCRTGDFGSVLRCQLQWKEYNVVFRQLMVSEVEYYHYQYIKCMGINISIKENAFVRFTW